MVCIAALNVPRSLPLCKEWGSIGINVDT